MARKGFYSFHYAQDNWRAAQVRNIGVVEGNQPAKDNDWESIKRGGDNAIERWIAKQLHGRSCTIVLVGTNTAGRKWVRYEIVESWNNNKGVVGVFIHGLRNFQGNESTKGSNPFDFIDLGNSGKKLSSIAKCYDPPGKNSQERYDWISNNIAAAVEKAISMRRTY